MLASMGKTFWKEKMYVQFLLETATRTSVTLHKQSSANVILGYSLGKIDMMTLKVVSIFQMGYLIW